MTKDEIIKLAHKAGFLIDTHAQQYQPNCILSTYGLIDENLERFAKLVAAAEREWVGLTDDQIDEIAVIARRGNLHDLRIAIEAAHGIKEGT